MPVGGRRQRQRREIQACGPTLGPLDQADNILRSQTERVPLVQQRTTLGGGEPQVTGAQLEEVALRAQPPEGQRGLGSGGKDQLDDRGLMIDHPAQHVPRHPRLQHVDVVQHQRHRRLLGQHRQQPRQHPIHDQ